MEDEALRRLVQARTSAVPLSRDQCPTPDVLQQAATEPADDPARRQVLDHIATCAPCRREFDLLRTADASAPAVRARSLPRWVPALAAAAIVVVVGSVVLSRPDPDAVVRGGEASGTGVELLPPTRGAGDTTVLTWRAVPTTVSYRVEVSASDGSLMFSTETTDTIIRATAISAPGLRWAVDAVRLDGTVLHSVAEILRTPR